MEKVDAQKEIDTLFAHYDDIDQLIGYTLVPDANGREEKLAYARVIFPKNFEPPMEMKWPEQLVYKRALEAGTGVQMFAIYPPGDFLKPLIAAEWEDSYQLFVDAADKLKMFVIEFITPAKKYIAMFANGKIRDIGEETLTPEDYDYLANKSHREAPDLPDSPKS